MPEYTHDATQLRRINFLDAKTLYVPLVGVFVKILCIPMAFLVAMNVMAWYMSTSQEQYVMSLRKRAESPVVIENLKEQGAMLAAYASSSLASIQPVFFASIGEILRNVPVDNLNITHDTATFNVHIGQNLVESEQIMRQIVKSAKALGITVRSISGTGNMAVQFALTGRIQQ